MRKKLTGSGRSARDATVNDIQRAINEMKAAVTCLNYCKGIGTELYISKVNALIDEFQSVKSRISGIK